MIHMIHIGKTGGSALKHVFREAGLVPEVIAVYGHHFTLADVPPGDQAVFFLRDPVSRFISAFYSRQRKGRPRYNSAWSDTETAVFTTFGDHQSLLEALMDPQHQHHGLAQESLQAIKHFWSTTHWLTSLEYVKQRQDDLLFVGFQESLDADFVRLQQRLQQRLPASATKPMALSLPTDDVLAHRSPSYDQTLTDAQRTYLQQLYAADVAIYQHCQQMRST